MPRSLGRTAARRAAAFATDLTCRVTGRRTVVRTARYVLSRARLDYPNDLATNGESALQRWILRFSQAGKPIHVADVGHNVGRGSESMLAAASPAGTNSLYPAPETIHVAQRCLVTNAPGKG